MLGNEVNGSLELDIQLAVPLSASLPDPAHIETWVNAVLTMQGHSGEIHLTVRVVDEQEGAKLNEKYRGKKGSTNVLSFPFEGVDEVDFPLLGDIVICDTVVICEATQQGKEYHAHWCHMVVHGILHLLGYDHQEEESALEMESREIKILKILGFSNPYQ